MQNQQQQGLQGQTARPTPEVSDPQQTESNNLQQTLDLQSIDGSQTRISVPGSSGETSTVAASSPDSTSDDLGTFFGIDVSIVLLVTAFLAAVVVIGALVKIAKPKHELQPEPTAEEELTQVQQDQPPEQPAKKPRRNKKMTRRQRRQHQKNS